MCYNNQQKAHLFLEKCNNDQVEMEGAFFGYIKTLSSSTLL